MPGGESLPGLKEKVYEAERRLGGNSRLDSHQLEELLRRSGMKEIDEIVGYGSESIAVSPSGKPQEVIAYNYTKLDPFRAKAIFYMQRVYSTIFPYNFPHFYAAFADKEAGTSEKKAVGGTIRQKIEGSTNRQEAREVVTARGPLLLRLARKMLDKDTKHREIKYPFYHVVEICQKEGLPLSSDMFDGNFIVGTDGGEYYVDVPGDARPGRFNLQEWDVDKFMNYMERSGYNDEDKAIVKTSLERLRKLHEEWKH